MEDKEALQIILLRCDFLLYLAQGNKQTKLLHLYLLTLEPQEKETQCLSVFRNYILQPEVWGSRKTYMFFLFKTKYLTENILKLKPTNTVTQRKLCKKSKTI